MTQRTALDTQVFGVHLVGSINFDDAETTIVVPAGTRFQVSLPSPLGVVGSVVRGEDRAAFEPVYEAALAVEYQQIVETIPNDQLAIQWDAALEFAHLEGAGYGSL